MPSGTARRVAAELAAGEEERFGAGMSLEQAIARLDGNRSAADAFNDGVVWDAVPIDDEREGRALASALLAHGIRCTVHAGKLVFRHADAKRVLGDLGCLGAASVAAPVQAARGTGMPGTAPQAVTGATAAVGGAPAPEPAASYFTADAADAAGAVATRAVRARAVERTRRERLAEEDAAAIDRLRARAASSPGHALSDAERAELLEHLAGMGDEREVPTLSSPLRVPEAFSHLLGFEAPAAPKSFAERAFRVCMQLLLIYAVCLTGEKLASLVPIGVPGNIVSMILLLVFLLSGVIRMESIGLAADFLLDHMAVFFVPAAVSIMGSFDLIAPNLLKLLAVCLITTVLVFFVTSYTVSATMRLMARAGHGVPASASDPSSSKEGE